MSDYIGTRLKTDISITKLYTVHYFEYPKNFASAISDIANRSIKILYDGFVLVEKFDFSVDTAGDLQYTLSMNEFNSDIVAPQANFNDFKTIFSSGSTFSSSLSTVRPPRPESKTPIGLLSAILPLL